MATFKELDADIDEYANPKGLGLKILNCLTPELYKTTPSKYNKLAEKFYTTSIQKDRHLSTSVLCAWLHCSDFKNKKALKYLNEHMYSNTGHHTMGCWYICDACSTSQIKCNILKTWCLTQTHTSCIEDVLSALIDHIKIRYRPENKLETSDILNLIIDIISDNKHVLSQGDMQPKLRSLLRIIQLKPIPDVVLVKLMSLYPHLTKTVQGHISKRYPDGKFKTLLSTAQALGVVDNPDYWIQSLPATITKTNNDSTPILPTFD